MTRALFGRERILPNSADGCFSDLNGGPGSTYGLTGTGGGLRGGEVKGMGVERRYCMAFN